MTAEEPSDGSPAEQHRVARTHPEGGLHHGRTAYAEQPAPAYDAGSPSIGQKVPDNVDYTAFDRGGRTPHTESPAAADRPSPAAVADPADSAISAPAAQPATPAQTPASLEPETAALAETTPGTPALALKTADVPARMASGNTYPSLPTADKTAVTLPSGNSTLRPPSSTAATRPGVNPSQQPSRADVPAYSGMSAAPPDVSYDNGTATGSYPDGTTVTSDPSSGNVLTQTAPDGTTYRNFTTDQQPQRVNVPATSDAPAASADISYSGGQTTHSYDDGSTVTYDSATNAVQSETMPDGTVYTDFDANGNPHQVKTPATATAPESTASISYRNGTTSYTYQDGTTTTYDSASNSILSETMPDGTVYTDFDANGNPQHADIPAPGGMPATSAAISYAAGQATYTYTDGTKVTFDSATSQIVKTDMPDGWTINYQDGKPVSASNAATGATVTITPDGADGSVWTYADGTKVWQDADGTPYQEQANGWTFTEFNGDGQPTSGTRTLDDGSSETVTINYDFDGQGDTQWIYLNNGQSTTVVTDPNGAPVSQTNPDGTSFQFAVEIPKLADAIKVVSNERDIINDVITSIGKEWDSIHDSLWSGPGGDSFYGHVSDFQNLQRTVSTVLDGVVQRMQTSYHNYVDVEQANDANLTPSQEQDTGAAPAANLD